MKLRQAVKLAAFQLGLHPRRSIAAPHSLLAGTRKSGPRYHLSRPPDASYVASFRFMKPAPHFATRTLLTTFLAIASTITMAKSSLLYIATQNPDAMGITVAEFDSATGALSAPKMAIETRDPRALHAVERRQAPVHVQHGDARWCQRVRRGEERRAAIPELPGVQGTRA
jgi:hypothetical protein